MSKYTIIKSGEKNILYNNYTGIFFEVNDKVIDLLKDESKAESCDELITFLKIHMFDKLDICSFSELFPKLSNFCIFSRNKIIYDNSGAIYEAELSEEQFNLLIAIKESGNLLETYEKLKFSYDCFCKLLFDFTCYECQLVKLFDKETVNNPDLYFDYNFGEEFKHNEQGDVSNAEYYNSISYYNVEKQFLTKETTVSFMLRKPSSILNGRTYGKTLFDIVVKPNENITTLNILEIGAGLGDVAYEFCRELRRRKIVFKYTICDISFGMLEYQKSKLNIFSDFINYVHCSGEEYCQGSYDVIICNEVIADLNAIKMNLKLMDDYPFLKNHVNKGYLNIGALKTLKNISQMLKKGGCAIVTEYFDEDGQNEISNQMKDHKEVSINFDILKDYMDYLGEKAEVMPLSDFLSIKDEWVLADSTLELIMEQFGFEKKFYTRDEIKQIIPDTWYNLHFVKVSNWFNLFKCLYIVK